MSGYQCMAQDCQKPFNWLVTHMSPAATFSLCDDDFPVMIIQLLAVELGADPEKLYDAIKRHVDREAARLAKEADKTAMAETDQADREASAAADAAGGPMLPPTQHDYDRLIHEGLDQAEDA